MAEAMALPASEHAGLLQQLKDSFSQGVDAQKESSKKEQKLLSDNTKSAARIAGRSFEFTKGLVKGIDSIAENTLLGYSLAKKSYNLAQRGAKAALRNTGKLAVEGLKGGAKKVAGVAKSIMDLLLDGAIMVGIFTLLKLFESGGMEWLTLAKDTLIGIYEWFKLLFTDPKAAMKQAWDKLTNGMSSLGTWIYDNALAPIWGWFKGMFPGAAGVMEKLFAAIATVTGNLGNWVYDNAIKPIWDWIGLLFDNPKEAMDKLFGAVVGLGTWVYNNAILPVWTWLGTLFSDPMLAINQYFKFVGNIGKWIYDNAILPIWNWFGETFPGAKAKLLEFWNKIFVESSIGSYIYNQMLKPLWDWIGLLFTNPKEALDKLWKFFKSFDTWIFNTVLDPLWTWFSGMFPDVAASLTTFWNKLFSGDDKTLLGKVGIFLTDMWTWFKGLFNFTGGIGATVASLLNFTFFFPNLVVKLLGDAWDYIKGLFGFKKDEAKLPKDFSVGKMIVDTATAIWGFIKGIFGFGEKKEAEVDDTELDKIKSKFSLTDMISGLVDSIVDFFTGLFDIDVMGIFRDIFDAAGAAGKKAWNFVFGGDEEKRLETEADLKKEEMVNATQAMAKLAQEFKTASLTADNIQLSDTALISLAKALTTGEGGVARSVVNNYVDNSSVTQSNATGNTIVNTKKNSKNEKAISEGN